LPDRSLSGDVIKPNFAWAGNENKNVACLVCDEIVRSVWISVQSKFPLSCLDACVVAKVYNVLVIRIPALNTYGREQLN